MSLLQQESVATVSNKQDIYQPVRSDVNIPEQEERILAYWEQHKIFEKTLSQTSQSKFFSFYDGPPFATGLPHYGHLLAGTLKDIVPRYWTMRGYHVPRRFGWDCHGLPVEYEIDKKLEIKNRKQVLDMGVATYNSHCRSIVSRYSEEWKKTVKRIGRFVDMDNAYFTMNKDFMQSVWWVFQQMWNKGLIYEGYKVVPYSLGVCTALSNFEASLNYKEVQDPAIFVAFAVNGQQDTYFVAWTTTPWTLPSNMALAVGQDIDYVKIKDIASGKNYYIAAALVKNLYKEESQYQVISHHQGRSLVGLSYEPLFPYFNDKQKLGAFVVLSSDHVTTESGSGIVHMAPAFGEDDFYVCQKANIPIVNPVDDEGLFTAQITDFFGHQVKACDKDIIARLKKEGKLLRHDTITHKYPFCWRTQTPLIYRAVSSYFVKVEQIKEQMMAANQKTSWIPEVLRDGRFGHWLENARDWAISRSRFWGTPIPVWKNQEGEVICVGSAEELEQLSGKKVEDLHIDYVDSIEIPSPTGRSALKRVPPVLDCWFESGSMPYAQWGYPFKHQQEFEQAFPADFIAEGLDQTRGWFYTLTVIGTALFGKSPFKNVIVNGIIVAEDGKKMSKSLRNYPDPHEVLNKHGADALRLYMIDSPVVRAQELRFSEKGVNDIVRRILLRWWNAYSFFVNYANIDQFKPNVNFDVEESSPNILDSFVWSKLHSLIAYTNQEMQAYRLYNVVPALLAFIEDLTNTYIRFNRSHFWQDGMPHDKRMAYETLYGVLMTLSRLMAPFCPFMAEAIYLNLATVSKNGKESVHLETYPEAQNHFIKKDLEQAVLRMTQLVMMGRNLREQIKVKAKIPLRRMRVIHKDAEVLAGLKQLEHYFVDELNIKEVIYDTQEDAYVDIQAKAKFQVLGPRLGARMRIVAQAITKLSYEDMMQLERGACLMIEGESISMADVDIVRTPKQAMQEPHWQLLTHHLVNIQIDTFVSPAQIQEGLSREVIRRIQLARKNAQLRLDDRIHLQISCDGELKQAVLAHQARIQQETLATQLEVVLQLSLNYQETTDVDELPLGIALIVNNLPS